MTSTEEPRRQLTLITFALISGVVLFAGVVAWIHTQERLAAVFSGTPIRVGAVLVGLGLLVMAQWIAARSAHAPGAPARETDDPDSLFTRVLIAQAVRESAGLLGGVVGYLTGDLVTMGVLVGASALAMAAGLPGREAWGGGLNRRPRP